MKILQLMTRAGPGSVPYTQFTLPWLQQHSVTLCTLSPDTPAPHRRLDCRPGTGSIRAFGNTLRGLLSRRSFDLVQIHTPRLGTVLLIAALRSPRWLLARSILHVHGSYPTYSRTDRWRLLILFLCCGRVVCCGHAARRSFPKWFRWCAGRRLVTIRHSVDLDLVDCLWPIRPATEWTEPPPLSLVTVGRLVPGKDHATILHALARAKTRSARLTVIGDGPLLEPLRTLAKDLKIAARVRFLGQIPHPQTLRRLWDADGFISMSRAEGLPLSALEAMACFCPVILSDIAAHREIRGRRQDLIPLVTPSDATALAHAIDMWDQMPPDVRRCWGADCRLHIEPRFASSRTLSKLQYLAEDLSPTLTPEWAIFCRCMRVLGDRRQATGDRRQGRRGTGWSGFPGWTG